jgi:hypothetical protein
MLKSIKLRSKKHIFVAILAFAASAFPTSVAASERSST